MKLATNPQIGLLMGSQSDDPVMQKAAQILKELEIKFEKRIVSAHRSPDLMFEYAEAAMQRGLKVIIAGAGGAAHLPGMLAAKTILPVIGVPIKLSEGLLGLDSLLSIVQMPRGVPVATVAINGAENAALLAAQILSLQNPELSQKLIARRQKTEKQVLEQNAG
jgi:5-(carboxyamino)imidazole ribonucleotide mutase